MERTHPEMPFDTEHLIPAVQKQKVATYSLAKPALACLSSRFPYGTPLTPERLTQVATCERTLHELGFRICRVRYYETSARIEVEPNEISRLQSPEIQTIVLNQFKAAGFEEVSVDPLGYRKGSLNENLSGERLATMETKKS